MVDDEPVFRDAMFRALTADGHDVALASDGKIAWDLIQGKEFDIIFADLKMPVLDGQGLYRLANDYSPDLAKKMVFITGDTASADARKFLRAAGNPVLRKPFSISSVRRMIQSRA